MGGKAFKSVRCNEKITGDELKLLKELIIEKLNLLNLKHDESFVFVGSSVDKDACNDIDVAIQCTPEQKQGIIDWLLLTFNSQNIKNFGDIVSIRIKKYDYEFLKVDRQLDVVFCTSLKTTAWLMQGLWRHMWFAWLAKIMTLATAGKERYTVIPAKGLKIITSERHNDLDNVQYFLDPKEIVMRLRAGVLEHSNNLEDLMSSSMLRSDIQDPIGKYISYISHLQDREGYDEVIRLANKINIVN